MLVEINGTEQEFNHEKPLREIIAHQKINTTGIAVAVNETVIPQSEWSSKTLKGGEKVMIVKATQGG